MGVLGGGVPNPGSDVRTFLCRTSSMIKLNSNMTTISIPIYYCFATNLPRPPMNAVLRRTMSRFTIANLQRMEVASLSEQLITLKSPDNSIAVIDVRDGGT